MYKYKTTLSEYVIVYNNKREHLILFRLLRDKSPCLIPIHQQYTSVIILNNCCSQGETQTDADYFSSDEIQFRKKDFSNSV